MFKNSIVRQVSRASTTAIRPPTFTAARQFSRSPAIRRDKVVEDYEKHSSSSKTVAQEEDHHDQYSTSGEPGAFEHEGRFSRTDKTIRVEYPEEENLPRSQPVQGRGGFHFKRTLASFSLEDRVGVVTGGARGLGLVMSQALVVSGADVAIVDLNSTLLNLGRNCEAELQY